MVRSRAAESLPTGWLIIPAIPTRKGLGLGVSPLLEKRNEMIRDQLMSRAEKSTLPPDAMALISFEHPALFSPHDLIG